MKGNLHQSYAFATIITEKDLMMLSSLVSSTFNFVEYEIKTKDGAEYCVNNIETILRYDNYDYRKIVFFKVKGNKQETDDFVFPNISISLCDSSLYKEACILDIRDMDDAEIAYFSQRIKDYTKQIRAPYWWCHKDIFYFWIGVTLYAFFAAIYLNNVDNTENYNKIYNILVLYGLSALCMVVSMYFGRKIISYFFPEGCFCIGEQAKNVRRKEKYRSISFWTFLITIILGVASNVISHYLINIFF